MWLQLLSGTSMLAKRIPLCPALLRYTSLWLLLVSGPACLPETSQTRPTQPKGPGCKSSPLSWRDEPAPCKDMQCSLQPGEPLQGRRQSAISPFLTCLSTAREMECSWYPPRGLGPPEEQCLAALSLLISCSQELHPRSKVLHLARDMCLSVLSFLIKSVLFAALCPLTLSSRCPGLPKVSRP